MTETTPLWGPGAALRVTLPVEDTPPLTAVGVTVKLDSWKGTTLTVAV